MNPAADFEGKKAREWSQDAETDEATTSKLHSPLKIIQAGAVDVSSRIVNYNRDAPRTGARPWPRQDRISTRNGNSEGGSRKHPSVPADAKVPERPFPSSKAAVRVGTHLINPSTGWAVGPDLKKNRYKTTEEGQAREREQARRYLGQPDAAAEYPGTGIYLWPEHSQDIHPREAFGRRLEDLDYIRKVYNVYIYWDETKRCLIIKSSSLTNAEHDIGAAIQCLQQQYRRAKAQNSLASPLCIVVPPSSAAMRAKVRVKSSSARPGEITLITGLELSGEPYTEVEKMEWAQEREQAYQKDFDRMWKHLARNIIRLAPLLERMRMRVHFGRINLSMYRDDFMEEGYSFPKFVDMMKDKRTITGSTFDRRMTALVAKNMITLIKKSKQFKPGQNRVFTLDDVQPKNTIVIFVKMEQEMLRLEAAIDHSNIEVQKDGSHNNYVGQYQMGCTSLYKVGRRNKHTELTTIDIERGIDWNLDIITDGSVKNIPSSLVDMISNSVTGNTRTKHDELGLPYPGVMIHQPDHHVTEIVIRSIYEYGIKNTDYMVEIAIYRSWTVAQWMMGVRPEPRVESGVTMYHQFWDGNMAEVQANQSRRTWSQDLKDFFPLEDEHSTDLIDSIKAESKGGLEGFLHAARYVKELLQEANRDNLGNNKHPQST